MRECYIHLREINLLLVYYKCYPPNHIFLKTFKSEFQEIKVWFTDQNSKPLEVEDKINLTLIVK